jgi:hypothetical protein
MPHLSLLRRDWKVVGLLLLVYAAFILIPNLKGSTVLTDPFHDGEYFAVAVNFFSLQPPGFHPLSIHGALDFIPALIARHWWGDEHYFLPTAAIYTALNIAAAVLLLLITYQVCKTRPFQWIVLVSMVVAAPFFVGYRDLLLLASLYCFLVLSDKSRDPGHIGLLIMLGALIGFGMFWSFDRGIATVVCLGPAMLLMAWHNRTNLIAAVAFGVTVVGLGLCFQGFSISGYLENLSVLLQTSGQWSYGWRMDAVILTAFVALINLGAIILAIRAYLISSIEGRDLARILALLLLSAIMLKIGVNRADVEHVYNGLWAPLLLTLSLARTTFTISRLILLAPLIIVIGAALSFKFHHVGFFLIACLMVYICVPHRDLGDFRVSHLLTVILISASASAVIYSGLKHFREGQYQWMTHVISPPANADAVTQGVNWASQRLLQSQASCVFDLSNNGVINGLLSLPSCTRFTYPVYAAAQHEAELISAITNAAPSAIVYSSTFPSYSIDGKTMRDRFQALDSYLTARYPREECADGYCVRYLGAATL